MSCAQKGYPTAQGLCRLFASQAGDEQAWEVQSMAVRARVQRLEEWRSEGGVSWIDWHREYLRMICW